MLKIELTKKVKANISQLGVNQISRAVVKVVKIRKKSEVSLALVSNPEIKKINQIYRGQNKVTDVLSFAANEEDFICPESQNYLGEIIISYPQLVRQARQNKCSIKQEFSLLVVHGLLHLLGYDHEGNRKEKEKMRMLEEKILSKFNYVKKN